MRHVQMIAQSLLFFGLATQGSASLAARPISVKLDPEASTVSFTGHSMNDILSFTGEGKGVTGDFKITGPKTVEGQAVFPMNNLDIEMATRARHMKEDLEVKTFPDAKFVPTLLPWDDPSQVLSKETKDQPFEGRLTLHGMEKPVKGTVSTSAKGDKVEFKFVFDVALEDHKINRRTFSGLQVGKVVNVKVTTVAKVVPQ